MIKSPVTADTPLFGFQTDSLFKRLPYAQFSGTELDVVEQTWADYAIGG